MAKYLVAITLALCLASAAAFVPSASFKLGSPAMAGRCALAPALRQVTPRFSLRPWPPHVPMQSFSRGDDPAAHTRQCALGARGVRKSPCHVMKRSRPDSRSPS